MRLDKFSLISMEMIDYQLKDPVLDQLHAIIEEYKKDRFCWTRVSPDLSACGCPFYLGLLGRAWAGFPKVLDC